MKYITTSSKDTRTLSGSVTGKIAPLDMVFTSNITKVFNAVLHRKIEVVDNVDKHSFLVGLFVPASVCKPYVDETPVPTDPPIPPQEITNIRQSVDGGKTWDVGKFYEEINL